MRFFVGLVNFFFCPWLGIGAPPAVPVRGSCEPFSFYIVAIGPDYGYFGRVPFRGCDIYSGDGIPSCASNASVDCDAKYTPCVVNTA